MTEPTRDDVVTVYEGKEGYALVDALEWRTMKDELARLRDENERLRTALAYVDEQTIVNDYGHYTLKTGYAESIVSNAIDQKTT